MKKLLLILLTPIILLISCGKANITPNTLEEIIVGTEWCLNNENEDGFLLDEDGKLYITGKCQPNTPIGNWVIDGDLIKYQFMNSTQEITIVWGEVTEYSESQIKLLNYSDSLLTITEVYILDTNDIYGCMDVSALNYNPAAECNDYSLCDFDFIENVYVNEIIDLSLPENSNIINNGSHIFIEGGIEGIIIYHSIGNEYKVYDRNCSYEPSLNCASIDSVNSGIAYCGCCPSAFSIFSSGEAINAPALLPLKQYNWSLENSIMRIFN